MPTNGLLLLLIFWALFQSRPPASSPVRDAGGVPSAHSGEERSQPYTLHYSEQGDVTPPANYREWVFLTSGLDMSYSAEPSSSPSFDNVFVDPVSYHSFLRTGTWPDQTILVLESRNGQTRGSINQSGHFQKGVATGIELHVKDQSRFPGGWAFFNVAAPNRATRFPAEAKCYSCHREHAAVDSTFVQFYPTLMPVALANRTLSPAYLKENADKSK